MISDSLLARARVLPASRAASVAPSPTAPVMPLSTTSHGREAASAEASAPSPLNGGRELGHLRVEQARGCCRPPSAPPPGTGRGWPARCRAPGCRSSRWSRARRRRDGWSWPHCPPSALLDSAHGRTPSPRPPSLLATGGGAGDPPRARSRSTSTSPCAQWEGYVAALHDAGWETIEVPPADECPDSVFVEDTVVMYGDRAVVDATRRRRAQARDRGDRGGARADLGYDVVEIEAPGTLDGGDVLKHGGTVWVGPRRPHQPGGRGPAGGLPRALRRPRGRRTVSEGAAPEVGRDRAARRHRDRLPAARRRPGACGRRSWRCPRSRARTSCCSADDLVLMSTDAPREPGPARGARTAASSRSTSPSTRSSRAASPACRCGCATRPDDSVGERAELVAVGIGQHRPAAGRRHPWPAARSRRGRPGRRGRRWSRRCGRRFFTVLGSGTPTKSKDSQGQSGICSTHEKPCSSWSTATPPSDLGPPRGERRGWPRAPRAAVPAQLVGALARSAPRARRRRARGPRGRRASSSARSSWSTARPGASTSSSDSALTSMWMRFFTVLGSGTWLSQTWMRPSASRRWASPSSCSSSRQPEHGGPELALERGRRRRRCRGPGRSREACREVCRMLGT